VRIITAGYDLHTTITTRLMRVWPLLLPLLHPTTLLSRAALSLLRLYVLLSVRCPPQPFIIHSWC
jgi:hypothetical protein